MLGQIYMSYTSNRYSTRSLYSARALLVRRLIHLETVYSDTLIIMDRERLNFLIFKHWKSKSKCTAVVTHAQNSVTSQQAETASGILLGGR